MTVGDRIVQARTELGKDRSELARLTKIPYSTLAGLESGDQASSTKLHVIADVLGVTVQWLATGKSPKTSPDTAADPATKASYLERPDFQMIADAVFLLQQLVEIRGWSLSRLSDPAALEVSYEVVHEFGDSIDDSNVIDLMKRLAKRLPNNGGNDDPGQKAVTRAR